MVKYLSSVSCVRVQIASVFYPEVSYLLAYIHLPELLGESRLLFYPEFFDAASYLHTALMLRTASVFPWQIVTPLTVSQKPLSPASVHFLFPASAHRPSAF